MVDLKMPVATEHKRIVASELIGIDDGTPPDGLNGKVEQGLRLDIVNRFDFYYPIPLKYTEYRDFVKGTSASFAFPLSPKVALIQLDLPFEEVLIIAIMGQDGHSDDIDRLEHGGVAEINLLGNLPGRELQFKELDDPEPLFATYPEPVNPSSTKIMKGIATAFTPIPFPCNPVDIIASTSYAETTVVFPT